MKKICLAVAVNLMGFIYLAPAFGGEKITWGIYDWPTIHIVRGEHKGKGTFDAITNHFIKRLPEYTHDTLIANGKRFWEEIKKGEHFCYTAALKTPERLKHAYFTIPDAIVLTNSVVMKKETAASIGLTGSVSLDSLLKNRALKGGLIDERPYGKEIDGIIADSREEANLHYLSVGNLGLSLYKMLMIGRVDYMIEYPNVISYFEEIIKKEGNRRLTGETVCLQIEDASPYNLVYAAFPKNEWGRKMTDRVNAIIREDRPTEKYRGIMEMWLKDKEKKQIRKFYDDVFMKQTEVN